ncbi:hypothetical protein N1851_024329 [Merluccius polli]|uniref:Uncharacterized protein n=1 Tax=Merluccius polli TaxID=89951 RepID=A0AA47NWZ8_MERPO|nr:hypothetical protein N1851_024329 [Merluccius polli]
MAEELEELRALVAQLRTDNDRMRQERLPAAPPAPSAPSTDRLVFVPRDRKCPMFRGRSGIGLNEWMEEVEACMRARRLSVFEQAYFVFDHLEGEAREEVKYRPRAEREDPAKIFGILQELYGCSESYVALQEAFFSRRQQEGETLQGFSLALMSLMASVRARAPREMLNADILLRDQFVEHVLDGALRRELKQFVRRQPAATLLDVRGEALRWEREGLPGGSRGRSHSVPSAFGLQCGVQGGPKVVATPAPRSELQEMREMLRLQQEQIPSSDTCHLAVAPSFVGAVRSRVTTLATAMGYGFPVHSPLCLQLWPCRPPGPPIALGTRKTSAHRIAEPQFGGGSHWLSGYFRGVGGSFEAYVIMPTDGRYLELDVMLCSKLIPGCGVLVVRDPPGNVSTLVPGVLGMNIIRRCYRELFGQHGLALFNLPAVAEAPESVTQALQKCHQASAPAHRCTTGRVKVRGNSCSNGYSDADYPSVAAPTGGFYSCQGSRLAFHCAGYAVAQAP